MKVIHPFGAQADGELSLEVGDYIEVGRVAPHGWSEGECKGKAGWFPSAYVEREEKAPASKISCVERDGNKAVKPQESGQAIQLQTNAVQISY
ncbi:SH3 domain [Dillenia turbinata]|uniref:SH3 domain n=1 Tax=Dillenia turbinata TaxID=194707 RepID=A0AAN8W6W9_9MAGN